VTGQHPEPEPPAAASGRPEEGQRLSPLTPVARGGILLLAVAATTWQDLLAGRIGPVGIALLAVLVGGAVFGWVSWLRTRFWIGADELRIDTGVLYHQSRRIRIDRLQGIDIVQPLLARLMGLAELKMDTAGGDREGSLAYLSLGEAHRGREVLLARRDAVRRGTAPGAPAGAHPGAEAGELAGAGEDSGGGEEAGIGEAAGVGDDRLPVGVASWEPPDHDLARLNLGMLLGSMLLAPETVALVLGGVALAVAALFVDGLLVAPGLPVMIGIVLVQGRKLSAYYGFTVSQTRAGLQVRRGLFERSTQTIALARVQGVVVSEPVMWRPLGWARLDVSLAGYGSGSESDGSPSATTVMPVAPRPVVMALAAELLHGRDPALEVGADPDAVPLAAPPRSSGWLDPFARRFQASGLGDQLAVARAGWFTRRTHVVRHARVQSVRLVQGPVQRRLGLADVHLDSPPGPVHVLLRNRASAEARRLAEQERTLSRQARRAS